MVLNHPSTVEPATAPPPLLGVGHVALNSADLARFRRFYEDLLGLELVAQLRMTHPPFYRHAFFSTGSEVLLHVFEVPGYDPEATGIGRDVGERGRIDHLGLAVGDPEALQRVADRLADAGASDGQVRSFGPVLSVFFRDPDGLAAEVTCPDPSFEVPFLVGAGAPPALHEQVVEELGRTDLLALLGGPGAPPAQRSD